MTVYLLLCMIDITLGISGNWSGQDTASLILHAGVEVYSMKRLKKCRSPETKDRQEGAHESGYERLKEGIWGRN